MPKIRKVSPENKRPSLIEDLSLICPAMGPMTEKIRRVSKTLMDRTVARLSEGI